MIKIKRHNNGIQFDLQDSRFQLNFFKDEEYEWYNDMIFDRIKILIQKINDLYGI